MISDVNRTQVLEATARKDPAKAEQKVASTWQGLLLVSLGTLFVLGSFVALMAFILRDVTMNLWTVLLPLVFAGLGIVTITYGATRWSGEYVGAALKDLRETAVGILRRSPS